nr:serine/threonine-protein kinase [Petropleomorpha daqingensis]
MLRLLGQGGMGQVWQAHDDEHDREVALKVLGEPWAADEVYRERFRREARVVARLREPHVVPIHRYGEIDGRLFLDMRLVEGESLAARLAREGAQPPAFAVEVVTQVAAALDAAHADGLVHRDVKPSNVLLARGGTFVYLVDFGIAATAEDPATPLTGTGLAIGSAGYMAPERFDGRLYDRRSDVYSLACVLTELLTGRTPFLAPDAAGLMYAHLQQPPPPPGALRPGLPPGMDDVVLRGLAKDPAQRWDSAGELAAAARAALETVPTRSATAVQPAPPAQPVPPPPGRRRWWLPVAAALLAAIAVAGWPLWALEARDEGKAATDAQQRLLREYLPDDVGDCTRAEGTGAALTALGCGPATSDDGPTEARYVLYSGGAAADSAFDADIGHRELPSIESSSDCSDGPGAFTWQREDADGNDVPAGRFACYVDDQGDTVVTWTVSDQGFRAVVQKRGGGEDGLGALAGWWDSHAT